MKINKAIIPYDNRYYESDYFIAKSLNGKFVFLNLDGKPISGEYDSVPKPWNSSAFFPFHEFYYTVKNKNKYGLLYVNSIESKELIPCKALNIISISNKVPLFKFNLGRKNKHKVEYEYYTGECVLGCDSELTKK